MQKREAKLTDQIENIFSKLEEYFWMIKTDELIVFWFIYKRPLYFPGALIRIQILIFLFSLIQTLMTKLKPEKLS